MNRNHSMLGSNRPLKIGTTVVAAGICLLLASAPRVARACDLPLLGDGSDSETVEAVAGSMAIMPAYGAVGVCGALMLPVDIYWKVQRPEDRFGAHAGDAVCPVVGDATYLAGVFPFFAGKMIFWDVPQALIGHGSPSRAPTGRRAQRRRGQAGSAESTSS